MLLLNPAFLYAATWLFVTTLYAAGLSDMLEPLKGATLALVIGSSAGFILGWAAESVTRGGRFASVKRNLSLIVERLQSRRLARRVRWAFVLFVAGVTVEIVYFGGAPFLSIVGIGPDIPYTEFGISGLHGVLNAIFYACCTVQFARLITAPQASASEKWLLAFASIVYPVLMMSRQVFISLLVQYLIIYLSFRRLSLGRAVRVAVLFIGAFLLFGYLGDIRSGRESIVALAQPTFDYPEWLPSAFIWFYIYLCTPLNNVNFNIDIAPHYFPFETIGTLIPSFARESFLGLLGDRRQWELVSESFNVSSLLQSFVTDFGVVGTSVVTFLIGLVFARLLRNSPKHPFSFFATVVFVHGIALSFFANLLFHLVFLFEILVSGWMLRKPHRPAG